MPKLIDLSGRQFGRWTVLSHDKGRYWNCVCLCGEKRAVFGANLRRGRSTGCNKCANPDGTTTTHGQSGTPLHGVWCSMVSRCENANDSSYERYGGRGIHICAAWRQSFDEFRIWALANGYAAGLTIDRVDNDGAYDPSNCRWTTATEQARNRRSNRRFEFNGEMLIVSQIAERTGTKASLIKRRLQRGWAVTDAVRPC